jgi:hypothetical protein
MSRGGEGVTDLVDSLCVANAGLDVVQLHLQLCHLGLS